MATMTGCNEIAKLKLAISCENTNRVLPIELGSLGSFTSMTYDSDSNNVTFTYEINEEINDIASMNAVKDAQKQSIGTFLKTGESLTMLERMVLAEATLTVVYQGSSSGQEFIVTFTPEELRQLADTSAETSDPNQSRLDAMIQSNAAQCPMDLGDGMVLTSVALEDGDLTYNYTVTGESYDFNDDDMPAVKETVGSSLSETFSGVIGSRLVNILSETGTGVRYVYHNTDNGRTYTVTFSPEEFAELVNAE